jgi:protein-tyrosine-phosphatase
MNILFICKYNRFRSKVAESYFKKINKNKHLVAKSAGLIRGTPITQDIISAVKDLGITVKNPPKGLSSKLLIWQNMTVIVADNVPDIFNNKHFGKSTIIWKIKDTDSNKKKELQKITKEIMKRVELLVKKLENAK